MELLSPGKIFIILVIAFILFGSKKLPEFGSSAGKALVEFKKAWRSGVDDSHSDPTSENK